MDFPTDLNGWTIYAHPCFKQQYDELLQKVEALKKISRRLSEKSRYKNFCSCIEIYSKHHK